MRKAKLFIMGLFAMLCGPLSIMELFILCGSLSIMNSSSPLCGSLSIMELFIPSVDQNYCMMSSTFSLKEFLQYFLQGNYAGNEFPQCLFGKCFISPSSLKNIGYKYWLTFFFFHHFRYVILCLLDFLVAINCIVVFLNCFLFMLSRLFSLLWFSAV